MSKYLVLNIGCLECGNNSEIVGFYDDLPDAIEAWKANYPKQDKPSILGVQYEAQYAEMQSVIIPLLEGEK